LAGFRRLAAPGGDRALTGRDRFCKITLVVATPSISVGSAVSAKVRVAGLRWRAWDVQEKDEADFGHLVQHLPERPGVYAVTGRHDATSGKGVLYIGEAGRAPERTLRHRVPASVGEVLLGGKPGATYTLYSDVWDLTIRWAELTSDLIDGVEELLIMIHSPPFNSKKVRKADLKPEYQDLLVMSSGRKGPIIPIVAGAYFTDW